MSRSLGSNFNFGRRILNEDELLKEIKDFLQKENRPEEFVMFDHRAVERLDQHLDLFQQTKVLIGPHGGGFYNLIFCPAKTLVIEFFPDNRYDQNVALASFWISTRMIDGKYYILPMAASLPAHDMTVDIPAIIDILRKELR